MFVLWVICYNRENLFYCHLCDRGDENMSLRFVIGRTGSGKTTQFFEEIHQRLLKEPDGPPIIYLVPEQMTFLSEYRFIHIPELTGVIRTQVYSFTRLAWRILQETGGTARNHITSSGLNMLIRKIIEDHKEELKIFKKSSDKSGFIQHVEMMLTEFKHYCIQPQDLSAKQQDLEFQAATRTLADKLHDLELIYEKFEQALLHKYLDSTDYLTLLANSIEHSSYLENAEVYVDGFHSFTPQEYVVLEKLLEKCKRVSVALVLNRPYKAQSQPNELDLFRITGQTYSNLYRLAEENQIEIEDDMFLGKIRKYTDSSLSHLEAYFERRPMKVYDEEPAIELKIATNRRAEVEGVAREIRKLIAKGFYRYKDVTVLMRNGHDYDELLETIFTDYEIPYFIDQKPSMLHHPLIEFIRSSLEVVAGNWSYESIFRAAKTDFLYPMDHQLHDFREKMDRLENYVLAQGIRGSRWTDQEPWKYKRYNGLEMASIPQTDEEINIENEINETRRFVTVPFKKLEKRLQKAKNGRQYCEAIYLLLEELDIPVKLENKSKEAEKKGQLLIAREHNQAWEAIVEMFDQFVEVLGEEQMTLQQFMKVLDSGLESLKFSLIPPAIDQVSVANLELSRLSNVKVAFVIGLNDGVIPAKLTEESVLSDDDRQTLEGLGITLAPDSKKKLLDEEFIAYRTFTVAEQKLFISYPVSDDEGKSLLPSPYVKRLTELFPKMKSSQLVNDPTELPQNKQLEYISHPNTAIAYLTSQLQHKKRGYPMADFWWDVYNYYIDRSKEEARTILSSLYFENVPKKLSEKTSKELYGEEILASVSRMEQFHHCPFSHFTSHGLRLREREIFRLDAPHIGDLFHAALKWMADEIQRKGLSWANLTKMQIESLAKEAVTYLAPKLQNQILLSSNRHHYIKRKLEQVISRASSALSHQAKVSEFKPVGLELAFGPHKELPPLVFTLKNGTKMQLQGRIDRVDKAEDENGVYLRIIDYKSSSHGLDLTEVYHGLALQMLTYLDIIITHSRHLVGVDASPAGVFYFHMHNPMISSQSPMTVEDIEKEILKKFKMKGLLHADKDIIRLMDSSLDTGSSDIISASINKNGSLSASTKANSASEEDFRVLRSYVRNLYKQSGEKIISGKIDIEPFKLGDRTPCQFCVYKPVCHFDQSFNHNQYRTISQEKPNDILTKIREGDLSP